MGTIIKIGKSTTNIASSLEYFYRKDQLSESQRYAVNTTTNLELATLQNKKYQQLFNDQHKIKGHHIVQSFSSDIKDQKQVYQAGQKLIDKIHQQYPNYAIHMALHNDTDNLHNHIMIENLNLNNGDAFYNNKQFLRDLRQWNDEVAQELNIEQEYNHEKYVKKDYELNEQGKMSHREYIKHAIIDCKNQESSFKGFKKRLENDYNISTYLYDKNRKIGYTLNKEGFSIGEDKLGKNDYGLKEISQQTSKPVIKQRSRSSLNSIHHQLKKMSYYLSKAQEKSKEMIEHEREEQQEQELEL